MRVLIAGGSGTIGVPLLHGLVNSRRQVIALTRSSGKAPELRAMGATALVADALDRPQLIAAVEAARPTHVIHELTALPKAGPRSSRDLAATNRLRIDGTRNLLEAAIKAGARRFIVGSYALLSPRASAAAVSEDPAGAAVRSMESQVMEATARGSIEGVILRYGMFYGPDAPSTIKMIELVRKRRLPVIRGDAGQLPLIHLDDAVSAKHAPFSHGFSCIPPSVLPMLNPFLSRHEIGRVSLGPGDTKRIRTLNEKDDCMGTALITGASAGLGMEFARLFAADNHSVILVARRLARLEELREELRRQRPAIRVEVLAMDLGTPGAGSAVFQKIEGLRLNVDFLVNNAGFGSVGPLGELPLERQLEMLDLNIRTLVELTRLVLPSMLSRGSGRILNLGSTAGFQPGPYMAVYYATKAFVISFSQAINEELRGTGVSCTVFAPGPTTTEFQAVTGRPETRAFRLPGMVAEAAPTAAAAYRAMMQGRAFAVPGFGNNLIMQLNRLLPRSFATRMAGALNKGK